jgi:hypothetical protein
MNLKKQSVLLVMMALLSARASAGTYSSGTGEPNNPYLIARAEDLNDIANHPEDFDKCFLMVADINLAESTGTMFNMIGKYGQKAFSGSFDGNRFKIYNFTHEANETDCVALFSRVDDKEAEIKNVTLIDPNVSSNNGSSIGALVGRLYQGTIYNCFVEGGKVSGYHAVGGLVGWNTYGKIVECSCNTTIFNTNEYAGAVVGYNDLGKISHSSAFGRVEGQSYVGGLVGHNSGSIKHCYSKADVSGNYLTGGLVGQNGGPVIHCFASSTVTGGIFYTGGLIGISRNSVTNCYAECSVSGQRVVGSLVGENESNITNCWAGGDTFGTINVGGIAGKNVGGTIENSFSKAHVIGDFSVGGITGLNTEGIIAGCYSIAPVHGHFVTAGLVGDNDSSILSCFWDIEVSGQADGVANGLSGEVYGVHTAELQLRETFISRGWDFVGETANGTEGIWTINNEEDCPKHIWELANFAGWDEVDLLDYSFIANHWLQTDCPDANNCDGTDLDFSGEIDFLDLKIFCQHWLEGIQ